MGNPEMGNFSADKEEMERSIAKDEVAREAEEKKLSGMSEKDKKKCLDLKAQIKKEREDGNTNYAENLQERLNKIGS
ncbi:MAG: hypothetical protein AAB877_03170 [Patescibacteria group bacterium]